MKRTLSRAHKAASYALAAVMVCALALVLAGCEAIGFGGTNESMPQKKAAKVSSPVIGEDGVLRVGVDAANAPFSTLVDDKLVGIDVDVAAAIADELGLDVKMVDVGAEPEAALDSGTVDVIMGVDTLDSAATCWVSDPYLETAVGIFATSSGAILPTTASNPTIEAQESSMSAWEITNQYGDDALKAVPDLKTAFEDLESGSVEFVASDAIIGSYVTHTSDGRAMLIGLMQRPGGYCVGVASAKTELQAAISEAVRTLTSNGTIGVVEAKWIGQTLNLGGVAYTEAAAKAEGLAAGSSAQTEALGQVGSNAVKLKDDGSTGQGNDAPIVAEGAWGTNTTNDAAGQEQPAANVNAYVETGAIEYVDPNAGATDYVEPVVDYTPEPTYTEPAAEPAAEGGDGGAEAGGEAAVDAGGGEAPAEAGGEAPAETGGEEAPTTEE